VHQSLKEQVAAALKEGTAKAILRGMQTARGELGATLAGVDVPKNWKDYASARRYHRLGMAREKKKRDYPYSHEYWYHDTCYNTLLRPSGWDSLTWRHFIQWCKENRLTKGIV
jgi:hypothetical protein